MVDARPRLSWAGTLPFDAAVAANGAAVERATATGVAELLAFEPAASVYTLGKRAQTPAGRLALNSTLAICAARGIAVQDVDRGGLGTLHGPGQLVVFVAWPCERPALRALVARLLAATAAVCRDLGVEASVDLGERVGVWHATGKLASLGLAHGHGVARHGLALNLAIDDALAGGLALCGSDCTRLANLGALAPLPRPSLRDLARLLARHLDAEHAA